MMRLIGGIVWDWEVEDLLRCVVPCFHFIEKALEDEHSVMLVHW